MADYNKVTILATIVHFSISHHYDRWHLYRDILPETISINEFYIATLKNVERQDQEYALNYRKKKNKPK